MPSRTKPNYRQVHSTAPDPNSENDLCLRPQRTPTNGLRFRHHQQPKPPLCRSHKFNFQILSRLIYLHASNHPIQPDLPLLSATPFLTLSVSDPCPANLRPLRSSSLHAPPVTRDKAARSTTCNCPKCVLNIPYLKYPEVTSVSLAKSKIHHMIIPGFDLTLAAKSVSTAEE
ncbi:hypothetical protein DKX38_012476 [Salix brachista]|uniref:Uncharacterized protein n=1 Tax=Salix brachista TaxID=2182728 RepID=A0A5N5LNJ0_9ROSI|nr:hypothetical protein DKX38_012476 [Salix brachista]